MTNISGNSSTQGWVKFGAESFRELESSSNLLREELSKNNPDYNKLTKLQQKIQKAARNHEVAGNMLQTIHNLLKKIIEKLQVN